MFLLKHTFLPFPFISDRGGIQTPNPQSRNLMRYSVAPRGRFILFPLKRLFQFPILNTFHKFWPHFSFQRIFYGLISKDKIPLLTYFLPYYVAKAFSPSPGSYPYISAHLFHFVKHRQKTFPKLQLNLAFFEHTEPKPACRQAGLMRYSVAPRGLFIPAKAGIFLLILKLF